MTYVSNVPSQGKIEGKFYPLQTEEHMRACRKLTKAQLAVLYYFKTLDPFGGKWVDIKIVELAKQLELSRMTISRALKFLDQLGWLKLKLISVQVQVQTELSDNDAQKCFSAIVPDQSNKYDNDDALIFERVEGSQPASSKGFKTNDAQECFSSNIPEQDVTKMFQHEHSCSRCNKNVHLGVSEPSPGKGFKPSKIIKTIKTSKTLSLPEKEREKFLEFANKKVDELPKRPQLPKKWIEKNHDELWAEYEELERRKGANEQQRRESTENQPETVVDPRIAAALENGEILEIDNFNKMFRVAEGWWYWNELDQWRTKQQAADYQATNEAMLATKKLIMEAAGIKSS